MSNSFFSIGSPMDSKSKIRKIYYWFSLRYIIQLKNNKKYTGELALKVITNYNKKTQKVKDISITDFRILNSNEKLPEIGEQYLLRKFLEMTKVNISIKKYNFDDINSINLSTVKKIDIDIKSKKLLQFNINMSISLDRKIEKFRVPDTIYLRFILLENSAIIKPYQISFKRLGPLHCYLNSRNISCEYDTIKQYCYSEIKTAFLTYKEKLPLIFCKKNFAVDTSGFDNNIIKLKYKG